MTREFLVQVAVVVGAVLTLPGQITAGTLYFSVDLNANGLYRLDTSTGAATHLGSSGVGGTTVGLAPSSDLTTLFGSQPSGIVGISANGAGSTKLGDAVTEGLAYDPGTDTLYGTVNGEFFTIDSTNGEEAMKLASPGADIEGLAYGNGLVYGLAGFSGPRGNLYSYSPLTDIWSFIAYTGVPFNLPGLAYDPIANVLYAKGSQDTFLYQIDPSTGVASVIGDTGIVNGGGLAYVASAPAVPEPTSMALFGLTALGMGVIRRRIKVDA